MATPDYRLQLEGRNLAVGAPVTVDQFVREALMEKVGPRLLSLSLTEKRDGEADRLDLELHDADGKLEIPKAGQVLSLQLGWKSGAQVPIGLVDKGRFKVDEAEWSGPPDRITIRARSADFAASFDRRQERGHVERTLGVILSDIAGSQGLAANVAADLAGLVVPVLDQDELSDAALLRRLGRMFDAAATVKSGTLIFAPIGSGRTASGRELQGIALTRADGDRASYRRGERGQFGGVEARWHDKDTAERKSVEVGRDSNEGKPPKRLKRVYASEDSAKRAAESAKGKMDRAAAELSLSLAYARPDLFPELPVTVSGFKPEIDAQGWLVNEATHRLDPGGFRTELKLEAR